MKKSVKVILRADDNHLLARCNNCIPNGAYPDSAMVHVPYDKFEHSPWAVFQLHLLDNGKYAFQADSGNFIARCNNCVPGAAYSDNVMVHVTPQDLPNSPWAQFTLIRLRNGKYALQSDSGNFVARCNSCIPNAAYPNSAFVHVSQNELERSPWAQWDIIIMP